MIPRYRPPFTFESFLCVYSRKTTLSSLEESFAQEHGYKYGLWFPYARVAMTAFLETLTLNEKKVALSPFNCIALLMAIRSAKFSPVFIDCAPHSFNQDEEVMLAQNMPLIPVALWGIPYTFEKFINHPYPVLHDLALGTLLQKRPPLKDEDAVVYSFNWGKPLTAGKGAFLCCDSKEKYLKILKWREERFLSPTLFLQLKERAILMALSLIFHPTLFGVVSKLHSLKKKGVGEKVLPQNLMPYDAALYPTNLMKKGTQEMISLKTFYQQKRQEQVASYNTLLAPLALEERFFCPPSLPLSHYAIRSPLKYSLAKYLYKHCVFTSSELFDCLLCDYRGHGGEQIGDLLEARKCVQETLHLPLYFDMTEKEQKHIIELLSIFHIKEHGKEEKLKS